MRITVFFFNDTSTTEIYTLSLHDALPIYRDGTKNGFELGVTRAITDAVEIPVIASGGVGTLDHLVAGVLQGGADAVLAASIFHFGEFTVPEAKAYMAARGIEVRL